MSEKSDPTPLRLGFARGTTPGKWAKRWAEARPHHPLELLPLTFSGEPVAPFGGERPALPDVTLERVAPNTRPLGTDETTGVSPSRRAVRLYIEGVALVVAVDHELAEYSVADRETLALVRLLDHPDHLPEWPAAEAWQDPSWRPKNAGAAMELVAAGTAAILLPLPVARHLAHAREHVVLPVIGEPELAGTEVWASWEIARDGEDIQQLIGVMRGRTARSSRGAEATETDSKSAVKAAKSAKATKTSQSQPGKKASARKKPGLTQTNRAHSNRKSGAKGTSKRRGSRGSR